MNHYRMSTGECLTKGFIDRKIRETKERKLELQREWYGYNFCEDCKRNGTGTRLDCSHEISVDECQKTGHSELAWSLGNIKIRCRRCHQIHDKNLIQKVKL